VARRSRAWIQIAAATLSGNFGHDYSTVNIVVVIIIIIIIIIFDPGTQFPGNEKILYVIQNIIIITASTALA